jgi:two-component system chemotaxis sensor kinase CheA
MSYIDPTMRDMLDTFVHETETMLEQLDEILLESERAGSLSEDHIGGIFRITHTIKGSAAMMGIDGVSNLSHAVEDVFYILRNYPSKLDLVFDTIFDLVFQTSDFLKKELEKLQDQGLDYVPDDPSELIDKLRLQAAILSGESPADRTEDAPGEKAQDGGTETPARYKLHIFFNDDVQMENIRAFMLLSQLQGCCDYLSSDPENPESDPSLSEEIAKNGFIIYCNPLSSIDEVRQTIESSLNVKSYEIVDLLEHSEDEKEGEHAEGQANADLPSASQTAAAQKSSPKNNKQSLISVNQAKLDQLMDLVGEIVTAESMVGSNPDLRGLKLDNFTKSFRELRKLTNELQDIVMSMRMVPLQTTFHKMERLVRDISKKLSKKAELVSVGGDTEVDKTINDAMVDPFMHMIRNSMDHGIESPEERLAAGKPEVGRITLSARNVGGEIVIEITDDGRGLDAEKILEKAERNGLLTKPISAYTDKEAFTLIMAPGFSTSTEVTEFSGRGVGMDVVRKNVEQIGGTISISSVKGQGTTFTIKIPLTLAIVNGMNISVGKTIFTLPIASISQSFKVNDPKQILRNTNGTEMILIRGECYPIVRLNHYFGIPDGAEDITEGILIQVNNNDSKACIFADELIGEFQVVVKPFPIFFSKYDLKRRGLSGCSILGDGTISLILDSNNLICEL